MKKLLPIIAICLLLTGCTTTTPVVEPSSTPVNPHSSPDTSIPTWRVGTSGELKRVIIGQQNGAPLECVVYDGFEWGGGVTCNWNPQEGRQ